jgi:hypothetical protein
VGRAQPDRRRRPGKIVVSVPAGRRRRGCQLRFLNRQLLAYVATVFVVGTPWGKVVWSIVLPPLSLDKDYVLAVVAVLGTTISPYLFFWQAEEEVEEEQESPEKAPLKRAPEQAANEFYRMCAAVTKPSSGTPALCLAWRSKIRPDG